ncbi:Zinc finger protein zfpm1 [Phlyctochytrium bullatum]|nr:Zinc finger protein zfpm1 [Phlyctochytrium bullatum]
MAEDERDEEQEDSEDIETELLKDWPALLAAMPPNPTGRMGRVYHIDASTLRPRQPSGGSATNHFFSASPSLNTPSEGTRTMPSSIETSPYMPPFAANYQSGTGGPGVGIPPLTSPLSTSPIIPGGFPMTEAMMQYLSHHQEAAAFANWRAAAAAAAAASYPNRRGNGGSGSGNGGTRQGSASSQNRLATSPLPPMYPPYMAAYYARVAAAATTGSMMPVSGVPSPKGGAKDSLPKTSESSVDTASALSFAEGGPTAGDPIPSGALSGKAPSASPLVAKAKIEERSVTPSSGSPLPMLRQRNETSKSSPAAMPITADSASAVTGLPTPSATANQRTPQSSSSSSIPPPSMNSMMPGWHGLMPSATDPFGIGMPGLNGFPGWSAAAAAAGRMWGTGGPLGTEGVGVPSFSPELAFGAWPPTSAVPRASVPPMSTDPTLMMGQSLTPPLPMGMNVPSTPMPGFGGMVPPGMFGFLQSSPGRKRPSARTTGNSSTNAELSGTNPPEPGANSVSANGATDQMDGLVSMPGALAPTTWLPDVYNATGSIDTVPSLGLVPSSAESINVAPFSRPTTMPSLGRSASRGALAESALPGQKDALDTHSLQMRTGSVNTRLKTKSNIAEEATNQQDAAGQGANGDDDRGDISDVEEGAPPPRWTRTMLARLDARKKAQAMSMAAVASAVSPRSSSNVIPNTAPGSSRLRPVRALSGMGSGSPSGVDALKYAAALEAAASRPSDSSNLPRRQPPTRKSSMAAEAASKTSTAVAAGTGGTPGSKRRKSSMMSPHLASAMSLGGDSKVTAKTSSPIASAAEGGSSDVPESDGLGIGVASDSVGGLDALDPANAHKKFICAYPGCGRSFSKPYSLKTHMISHSGNKPHKCLYCSASFARKHDMLRHVRTVHGNRKLPAECQLCQTVLTDAEMLVNHLNACPMANSQTSTGDQEAAGEEAMDLSPDSTESGASTPMQSPRDFQDRRGARATSAMAIDNSGGANKVLDCTQFPLPPSFREWLRQGKDGLPAE